ncbi:MAG: hypothetical protein V3U57_05985 [Robiginitomaculum sp.]
MPIAKLNRTIISLRGEGVEDFLAGLITNSLKKDLTFAALLTPQGKIIADFFVHKTNDAFLIETPEKFGKVLLMRLKMYKLRAKINIEDISHMQAVYVFWNGTGDAGLVDPRAGKLGQRLLTNDVLPTQQSPNDYDMHRLSLGVPDSAWDFDTQHVFPANANMDMLCGLDLKKGCFIGQEVVSRMHRKTTLRKRMCKVKPSGPTRANDAILADGKKIGVLNHVRNDLGIATIRLDRLANTVETPSINDKSVSIMEPNYDT